MQTYSAEENAKRIDKIEKDIKTIKEQIKKLKECVMILTDTVLPKDNEESK